ncbi:MULTISPECIES: acyl carrier protein [unclassified Micromonospora]|uniref:acyl carrier protein n=1 Tax=unclassified Micromonospora TaxID=2617518 RepID=UPI0020B37581|nr:MULTISPECIES: acyl carrier protein [unclassified Micromonospora]MDM4784263.1 acyl carrier protein [Micromonospora sp. b486]
MTDIDDLIARHAVGRFDDDTTLAAAGIGSLTILRMAVEAAPDDGTEIDASRLADVHTVGNLRVWLRDLLRPDPVPTPATSNGKEIS